MKYLVSVTFRPIEGKRDALAAMIAPMLEQTRNTDGCLSAHLCFDTEKYELVILHLWTSGAAFEDYLEMRAQRGDLHSVNDLLADEQFLTTFNVA